MDNPPSGSVRLSALRVFLIEDDEAVRETQRRLLENDRRLIVVGEASSGEEALESLASIPTDVVTVDLLLPGMSGIETIGVLKERFPAVKVVVLSAYGGDFMERSVQAGADAYVLKPYDSTLLVERVLSVAKR